MISLSIAIDGPSGAGKSTLAKMVAERYGMIYVDTGAMYRCIGLYALENGVGSKDIPAVTALLKDINVEMKYIEGVQRMFLNGNDVTDDIRKPAVSIYASDVSAIPAVREFLLEMQRGMADKYNVIMDGRDISTVVLPDAGLKIFLTATPETRAKRRYDELAQKGIETTFEEVLTDINYRDKNDSSRETAPLKPAADSVIVDTTELDLNESYMAMCALVKGKFNL